MQMKRIKITVMRKARYDDLIEKSLFLAGKAFVGGVAEFENENSAVAVNCIINSAALVMDLDRLRPAFSAVVAEKAYGGGIRLKIAAKVAQAEKNDGAVVADNCLFAADKISALNKAIVGILQYLRLAPGYTAVGGTSVFYPTVHGMSEPLSSAPTGTVGIKGDKASVLTFYHGVTEVTRTGIFCVVNVNFFFFDDDARIIFR